MSDPVNEGLDEKLMKAMQLGDNVFDAPTEEVVEEKKEEVVEESAEETTDTTKTEEVAEEKVIEKKDASNDGVPEAIQRRIDELTAKIYEERRAREAAELKLREAKPAEASKAPKTVEECNDDQLQVLIRDHPEFAEEARVELATRRSMARMEAKMQAEREQQKRVQLKTALDQEWSALETKHPTLKVVRELNGDIVPEKQSALYQLANKHYNSFDVEVRMRPGSMRAAVALAKEDLDEGSKGELDREKARLEKARQKSAVSAASSSTKSGTRTTSVDAKKLEERAVAAASNGDMNHPDWIAFMKSTRPKKSKEE